VEVWKEAIVTILKDYQYQNEVTENLKRPRQADEPLCDIPKNNFIELAVLSKSVHPMQ
jgi:hypothetical protein